MSKQAHWNCSAPAQHRRARVTHASRTHRQWSGTWISLLVLPAALDPLGPSLQGGSRECRRAPHPLTLGASRGRWQRLCSRKAISTSDQCDLRNKIQLKTALVARAEILRSMQQVVFQFFSRTHRRGVRERTTGEVFDEARLKGTWLALLRSCTQIAPIFVKVLCNGRLLRASRLH